jgi:hypothetical protein
MRLPWKDTLAPAKLPGDYGVLKYVCYCHHSCTGLETWYKRADTARLVSDILLKSFQISTPVLHVYHRNTCS